MQCRNCHSHLKRGEWFCTKCGTQVLPGQFKQRLSRKMVVLYGFVMLLIASPVLLFGGGFIIGCYQQYANGTEQIGIDKAVLGAVEINGKHADKIEAHREGCSFASPIDGYASATFYYTAPSTAVADKAVMKDLDVVSSHDWEMSSNGPSEIVGFAKHVTAKSGTEYKITYNLAKPAEGCNSISNDTYAAQLAQCGFSSASIQSVTVTNDGPYEAQHHKN